MKLLLKAYNSPASLSFADFQRLVEGFEFRLDRTSGSHHIYVRADIREIVNIQSRKGAAKPYQVRQFLQLVERAGLPMETNE